MLRSHDALRDRRGRCGRCGRAYILAILLAAAALPWVCGCTAFPPTISLKRKTVVTQSPPEINVDEVRSQAMSLADSYSQTILQSMDSLIATTKDPARADWARGQRLVTITASITNATGPNAVVGLLDMVVFATLKRVSIEEYWLPTLLGEEGRGVLEAHRRGEADAWAAARHVLTESQVAQLNDLIGQWRLEHRGQHSVAYTRFSDFDAYRNLSPDSPQAKTPGSLFSLFYVDPLAGLDPVARELRGYRALSERMTFIAARLPMVAAYQIDVAVTSATGNPEVRSLVASAEKISIAADGFAKMGADYPKAFSAERDAAIKQVADVTARERQAAIEQAGRTVAEERQAFFKEIDAQDGRIRRIVGDATGLVERAERAGNSINASTAQTVASTEQATRRTLDHAFWLLISLAFVVLVGVPVAVLAYRAASRRLPGEPGALRRPENARPGVAAPSDALS